MLLSADYILSADYTAYAIMALGASILAWGAYLTVAPSVRYTRRGGMRFLRIGRLQMSWCICRRT